MKPAVRFVYVGPALPFIGLAKLQKAIVDGHRWLEQKARRRCAIQGLEMYPREPNSPLTNENVWGWALATQAAEYDGDHVVFLIRGTGGFAGGNASVKTAVLGDWCLDELLGLPSDRVGLIFSRNAQIGAMLHEALHLFWLDHEDLGIMSEYWNWPDCSLPQKAIANNDLFGDPLPPPNPIQWVWRWVRAGGMWGWQRVRR